MHRLRAALGLAVTLWVLASVGLGRGSTPVAAPTAGISDGTGSFRFIDEHGNADKPLTVFYYQPRALPDDAPVLFVMHGQGRGARGYCDAWQPYAERKRFLLLCPMFDRSDYPTRAYNQGHVFDADQQPVPRARWTFSAIEHLFDYVTRLTGNTSTQYYIYGHSAGAQFVHRLVLLLPEARYAKAIAANAGVYTLPVFDGHAYPYGLRNMQSTAEELRRTLSRPLLVLLGEEDTNPNHHALNKTAPAQEQGQHRLARGHTFYATAQQAAAALGVELRWTLRTVPGAGHDNRRMAASAVQWLFP